MRPLPLASLNATQLEELYGCFRSAPQARVRIPALMVLLAAERGMVAADVAAVVRQDEETVRRWLVRYQAEGLTGLADVVRMGAPPKVAPAYREQLLAAVRRRWGGPANREQVSPPACELLGAAGAGGTRS